MLIERSPALMLALSILALAGCGEGGESRGPGNLQGASPPTGNTDGAPESVASFVLADEPDVTIGVMKGEAPYNLSGVAGAIRLSDGRIVIANCQSGELRYFDQAGRFLRSVGRLGPFSALLRG